MTQCDSLFFRKPTVYVLVGCPASGKSSYSTKFFSNVVIISFDKIREELYGKEDIQGCSSDVFKLYYQKAKDALKMKKSVVLDATNLTKKNRKNIFKELEDINCQFVAIVFQAPLDVCLYRNSQRNKVVPKEVLTRMYYQYVEPSLDEGFSEVRFVK